MDIQPSDYLPIEVIFNLLCVLRRGEAQDAPSLRNAMQRRGLVYGSLDELPRLSFWIRLCQAGGLLDEMETPVPTLLAQDWFGWRLGAQLECLVQAWVLAPQTNKFQQIRWQMLNRLLYQEALGATELGELGGLQALGICIEDQLTLIGQAVLTGQLNGLVEEQRESWQIENERLQVPYPPDWSQLWVLETYIDPLEPGVYPLAFDVLRQAAQRGAMQPAAQPVLPILLEAGLGSPPPHELLLALQEQPVIHVLPGPVLAFDSEEELLRLRQNRSWRKELGNVLSSRHVHLDPWRAPVLLRRLQRLGLLAEADLEAPSVLASTSATLGAFNENPQGKRGPYFSIADRAYILALLLLAEGLQAPFGPPLGFFAKLVSHMDESLRATAARKANKALTQIMPIPKWIPEEEPPEMPEADLIEFLEEAIRLEQPIDVMYQAAERSHPEYRHITPYLLEQRGLRWYLIGYCHTRRANRTFRLDRMKLLEHPPIP